MCKEGCSWCGKEAELRCCDCCIACGESCNCCRSPSISACLDSICCERKVMCFSLLIIMCNKKSNGCRFISLIHKHVRQKVIYGNNWTRIMQFYDSVYFYFCVCKVSQIQAVNFLRILDPVRIYTHKFFIFIVLWVLLIPNIWVKSEFFL